MNEDIRKKASASKRRGRVALATVMFLLGACGLAYEYTLSKIAADLLGNSVQQWATMIATMLFAMGLGAEWQSKIATEKMVDRLVVSQVVLAFVGGFAPMLMLYSFSLMGEYYVMFQYGLAMVVGTMIGFEIPLIMRINEAKDPEMKVNLARILKMDYIGALVGALLWTFVLVRYFSLSHVSFLLGLVSVFSASMILWLYREQVRHPVRFAVMMGVTALALLVGMSMSRPLMLHAEQYLYRDKIVFSATTPYQHIVLTENANKKISCYINGHLQFKEDDEFIYHENLVHPAMMLYPNAQNILVLGGGDGLAVREILKYPSVRKVVLVDIDPQMTELARHQPEFLRLNHGSLNDDRLVVEKSSGVVSGDACVVETPNRRQRKMQKDKGIVASVNVINLDAGSFLQRSNGVFDVVILDFPDPNSPDLAKLYSQPFYRSLRRHLKPQSIVVQQSGSPFHAKEAFLCIGRTWKSAGYDVIPYHDNVPSFGEWGWWIGRMLESSEMRAKAGLNSDGFLSFTDSNRLKSKIYKKMKSLSPHDLLVDTRYLTIDLVKSSMCFGKSALKTENKDISSLMENRVYHYYLQGWK